jgi:hypothetical protein
MASAATIPSAPSYLSKKAQKQWTDAYVKALAQAKLDRPENIGAQNNAALKAANALLAVPAPTSAKEIDNLEDWQKILDEVRGTTRHCVTSDGRKYSFPVEGK